MSKLVTATALAEMTGNTGTVPCIDVHDENDKEVVVTTSSPPGDCPLCFETMHVSDVRHPIQCHCGFNFCQTCIDGLISASQDDYQVASDGSRQVKTFLHCPQCRTDLRSSLWETLLLRKVDQAQERWKQEERQRCQIKNDDADNRLPQNFSKPPLPQPRRPQRTPSLFGIQATLQDDVVNSALSEASQREAEFFGWNNEEEEDVLSSSSSSSSCGGYGHETSSVSLSDRDTDWGVEADLWHGVHSSFRIPVSESVRNIALLQPQRILAIDTTLLGGLVDRLTKEQQEEVTDLLTSGDPAQLLQGASILHQTTRLAWATAHSTKKNQDNFRGIVYGLIAKAKAARQKVERPQSQRRRSSRRRQAAAMIREMQQQAQYLQNHPLPVRLPKSVSIHLPPPSERGVEGFQQLKFCHDEWDGTLRDVFCPIHVVADGTSRRQAGKNNSSCDNQNFRVVRSTGSSHGKGVQRILDSDGPVHIDVPKPRVVVAAVDSTDPQLRSVVAPGDVVTHLNGEAWSSSVSDLQARLQALYENEETTAIHLGLNCSVEMAQVLQRRSLVD